MALGHTEYMYSVMKQLLALRKRVNQHGGNTVAEGEWASRARVIVEEIVKKSCAKRKRGFKLKTRRAGGREMREAVCASEPVCVSARDRNK